MYRDIKQYLLTEKLYRLHKRTAEHSDFGMDNNSELLDGGFGVYSTVNTITEIGPVKTEYYRIALICSGTADYTIGLETFHPQRHGIVFGFPGQIFSLHNASKDFFAYYMLFSEQFIAETILFKAYKAHFPFLSYSGIPCFALHEEDGVAVEHLFLKISNEIKDHKADVSLMVKLYVQEIFILAGRNYAQQLLTQTNSRESPALFSMFLKLVSEHFHTVKKVASYAGMMHISADHLNRIVKLHSNKTAGELIDEMILREAKAYLLYSERSISEIAYQLDFSDPSHFNKFFKNLENITPLRYRQQSGSDNKKS